MATIKRSKMTVAICGLIGILVMAAWLLVPVTQAEEETTKSRIVFFFTRMETVQVGDEEEHLIGVYESKGLSSHENGEVAIYRDRGTFDTMEGFQGYGVYLFEGGSTQWAKYQGTSRLAEGGAIELYEGTFEYIKGSGRFEGIKGGGSFTGKHFVDYGVAYIDLTGSYTLP